MQVAHSSIQQETRTCPPPAAAAAAKATVCGAATTVESPVRRPRPRAGYMLLGGSPEKSPACLPASLPACVRVCLLLGSSSPVRQSAAGDEGE